jgi:hypothetical protein
VSLCDFADAAGVDAETCKRTDEIRSRNIKPHQPDTRWPQQQGNHLGPHHANKVIEPLRPAYNG